MRCSLHSHRQWYFVFLSLPPILFRYVQKREEALRNGPTFIQTKWTLSNCLLPLNRATALKFFRCMRWQETEKGNRHIFFFSFYSYSLYIFLNLFFFLYPLSPRQLHLLFIFYPLFFLLLLSLFFKLSLQWSFWPVTKVMGTVSSPKRHTSLHRRWLKTLALHPPPTDQRRYQKRVWRQQWPSR